MAEVGGAPPRSFAQAAQTEEVVVPLRSCQIDGLVLMKMAKHCKECMPGLVTGLLLGLDIGSTLEVTNCFPFPSRGENEEEDEEADSALYQIEMMRCLRDQNVDNNTVGWYQSTYMGGYATLDLIETFLNYQENIKRCVCLIFDPQRSNQGVPAVKALKLKDKFMELYRSNNFVSEQLRDKKITWEEVYEELPVRVANNSLVTAVMSGLAPPETSATQADVDRLSLSNNPFLERNLEFLIECMDDLGVEQQKLQFYARSVARQQSQQLAFVQKRRAENATRRAAGEEPLPEEDPSNPIFKPVPEPSRIDAYLITNQISNYCSQINVFTGPALSKMYLMDAFHGAAAPSASSALLK